MANLNEMTTRERQLHVLKNRAYRQAFDFFAARQEENDGRGYPVKYRAVDCAHDGV